MFFNSGFTKNNMIPSHAVFTSISNHVWRILQDKVLRIRILEAEKGFASSLAREEAEARVKALQAQAELLDR